MMKLVAVVIAVVTSGCGSVVKPDCGDGKVTGTEECDEGAMNGDATSCCSATCSFIAAGMTCRAAVGVCDIAETCSGASGTCPADVTKPDGMACAGGNGVNECSHADTCLAGVCSNNDIPVGQRCSTDVCNLDVCTAGGTCPAPAGKVVTITDSSTAVPSENMDLQWKSVATAIGYSPTIVPKTTLDNLANLANTDILIISSSSQALTAAENANVATFMATGKGVYVQGEYVETFAGNILFKQILDANNAGFTWGPDITGQFLATPVGCFGTTPNPATVPFNQNYGVTGMATAAGLSNVQLDSTTNQPVAFAYCRAGGGMVIIKTDQDDIRTPPAGSSVLDLMKNILYKLTYASTCVQ